MTGNTDHDGTIHWSIDVEDLPIAYQAVKKQEINGELKPVIKTDDQGNEIYVDKLDENGNPVYKQAEDENGNPAVDNEGNPIYEQAEDENGYPIWQKTDANGTRLYNDDGTPQLASAEEVVNILPVYETEKVPVYETELHYIQYVVTEKYVENYKVPQYEILEDTASVIITNEIDGIVLPGTGSNGIHPIVFAGIVTLMLGAVLFYNRYKKYWKGDTRS